MCTWCNRINLSFCTVLLHRVNSLKQFYSFGEVFEEEDEEGEEGGGGDTESGSCVGLIQTVCLFFLKQAFMESKI